MPLDYPILGVFVPAEIPYNLIPDSATYLDLAKNPPDEFPVTTVVAGDHTRQTDPEENKVTRHGWLAENSQVHIPPGPSAAQAADLVDHPELDELTYRLVPPGGNPLTIGGKEVRITKVVAVPYQGRRDGDIFPRQTFILVCYRGPDGGG